MKLAVALIATLPLSVAAQTAVEESPAPQSRPDPEDRAEEVIAEIEVEADESGAIEVTAPATSVRDSLTETEEEFAACLAQLDGFGTVYEVSTTLTEENDADCGVTRPLMVTEIIPGVALQPDAMMRCATVARLAEWMQGSVQPAAALIEDRGPVIEVQHGSTYICRRRNNLPDGKLSEHAFGNAVDVMGFTFEDGSRLNIEPRADAGTIEEAFQRAVRGAACLSFTTVLGPGTDAAHADHLHLDIKERNGGYRLCQ
ncbi:extensin family protein [Thalassorhabdomicrobium marinisediminis]|uniref:extensin-like domain-containing protein n=1 Tax=Thalassorhabdomicrobium marinisediminis TaxID=2170577 RepID=UPI0024917B5F|nr:extensin family protein [Thalassorhabdomicrobium marinisediminis]